MNTVTIGGSPVGDGYQTICAAEFGINHNGSVEIAKKMIDAAIDSGCNFGKFQKRDVDVVYSAEELARPRESPFGTTNGELKRGLEFDRAEYVEIDMYCKDRDFTWIASAWNESSVDFLEEFNVPFYKIASACLTDDNLLKYHRQTNKPIILSTGMSTWRQIDHAIEILGTDDLILLHCTSTYPCKLEHLNLLCIPEMKRRYNIPIGFSGHDVGLSTTVAAAVLGAKLIERHLTLDRSMFGSDQPSSVEPQGFSKLVQYIRSIESAMGDGEKRIIDDELPIMKKLRRVG